MAVEPVAADELCLVLPVVREFHDDLVGVLDDVVVGENEPVAVDDRSRAEAALAELARRHRAEESLERFPELTERIIAAEAVRSAVRGAGLRACRDVHHARGELCD